MNLLKLNRQYSIIIFFFNILVIFSVSKFLEIKNITIPYQTVICFFLISIIGVSHGALDHVKGSQLMKIYKVKNNFCLFTLNVPWSYHAVSKYNGKNDRKFFYSVYDFPTTSTGKKLKNRKKGNNQNQYWKSKVSVKSSSRKKKFFSE